MSVFLIKILGVGYQVVAPNQEQDEDRTCTGISLGLANQVLTMILQLRLMKAELNENLKPDKELV